MPDLHKSKIRTLLEKLQEESWQLELLISGFAIFLVAASWDPLQDYATSVQVSMIGLPGSFIMSLLTGIMIVSWFFLIANLILHVVMRGFWISAIGVRYVSGDINFDALGFAPKFDRYLRKRIPSFDHFIERLEKVCSVVFAFTFLIIFILIAFGLFLAFNALIEKLLSSLLEPRVSTTVYMWIDNGIDIVLAITALVYFIDFVTLGWIKRRKRFARIYYPFYRFYSFITLAFLYRPLYYNLIGDKFGKRVALLLLPYMIIVGIASSLHTEAYLYFTDDDQVYLNRRHYDDGLEKRDILRYASIPSKYVKNGYLQLFIPYTNNDDQIVEQLCPGITASKTTGMKSSAIQFSGNDQESTPPDSLLMCVSEVSRVSINDSLISNLTPRFYVHPNQKEHGLLHVIDIEKLERGEHQLLIEKQRLSSDTLRWLEHAGFPFWKE